MYNALLDFESEKLEMNQNMYLYSSNSRYYEFI